MKIRLYSRYLKIITLIILFLILFLVFINIFLIGFEPNNIEINAIESNALDKCSVNKWEALNIKNFSSDNNKVYFEAYDLNIFPQTENFYCLGKVIDVKNNSENKIIYIGANRYLFDFFNKIINFSLIILLLGNFFKNRFLGFLFFIFNLFNFYLFRSELTILKSIFPYTNPQSYNEIFVLNVVFLCLLVSKVKNDISKIVFIYLLVFFIPDYFGFFLIIILILINRKNFIDLNDKLNVQLLTYLPVAYYIIRTIYSFSSYFDNFWMLSGQRVYHGISRYADGLWNFEAMACIQNPNIFDGLSKTCRELSAGILDDYIYITTEPYLTTLFFMAAMHFCILFIYFDVIKRFNFNKLYVSVMFVSPAFNFLTYQGNFDVLFLVVAYISLIKLKKYNLLISLIFFFLSLYKLHTLGAIFGLILYFLKQKNKKLVYTNLILFSISLFFALSEIIEGKIVSGFGTFEYSYGILNLANLLNRYLEIGDYFIYSILLLFVLILTLLTAKFNFLKPLNNEFDYQLFYYVYTYWFLFTLFTVNNSYRVPIFFLILLIYMESNIKLLRIPTILFLFLSIIPVTNYGILITLLIIIKYISMILIIISILFLEYNKTVEKLKKVSIFQSGKVNYE